MQKSFSNRHDFQNRVGLKYFTVLITFLGILPSHQVIAQNLYSQHYTTQNGLAHNIVYSIKEDKNGFIWLGTNDGISRFDGTEFRNFTIEDGLLHYAVVDISLYQDSSKLSFLYGNGEQQHFSNQTFQINKEDHSVDWNKEKMTEINLQNQTFTWDTLGNRLLWEKSPDETPVDLLKYFKIDARTTNILLDYENHLWITTEGDGVYVIYTSEFNNYGANEGLTNVFVNDIMEDNQGRLWAGTKRGFHRFKNNRWFNSDPESNVEVYKFQKGLNSNLFATTNEGIFKIHAYPENCLPEENRVNSFIIDDFGQINLLHGGYFYIYKDCYSDPSKWVVEMNDLERGYCLFEDNKEQLWVGTNKGIFIYNDLKVRHLTVSDGLPSNVVNDIQQDENGAIWIASERGLARMDSTGKIRIFTKKEGLLTDQCRRLCIDPRGGIWIATPRGLHFLKHKTITPFNEETGLSSSDVNSMFIDKEDKLWIGTSNGIASTSIRGLPKFAEPPKVFINTIRLNGKVREQIEFKQLPFDSQFEIDYTAITFQNASEVVYQYRLNENGEWQTTQNRSLNLTDLRQGVYKFQLRAKKINSQWSEPVGFQFQIDAPYWLRWWFFLIVLGAVVAIAAIVIVLIRRQEARKTIFNKQLAELELSALQSQMNPHFIFNAMNAIQEFIVRNDTIVANRYLTEFATLMRLYLESSKSKYITIDEELKLLKLYISFEKVCYEEHFDYQITVDDDVDEEIEIPSMFIQPFVENAIRHGLINSSIKGNLLVKFKMIGDDLVCEITDNGIGRREAAKLFQLKSKQHKSRGMEIIEQRQSVFNNLNDNSVNFEIIDLIENGKSNGTNVIIRFDVE